MIAVIDASVALKWFFRGRSDEDHVQRALDIVAAVAAQRLSMIQPPHFLAEMAAVLAREKPDSVQQDIADLGQIDWTVRDDGAIYARAVDLAVRLDHHLFDTLYHALALEVPQATLVTADRRYYRRARRFGQIKSLGDFALPL